jgi:5-methyltetrahydropteroyltriglutamate--homocysteine methyltransferase
MKRSDDRILTTHVGSLVRPASIVLAMRAKEAGQPYDEAKLAADVKAAVGDVVHRQKQAGIDVPSDGEQGKTGFFRYLYDRLENIKPTVQEPGQYRTPLAPGLDRRDFADFYAQYDPLAATMWLPPEVERTPVAAPGRAVCDGPLRYRGEETLRTELATFRAAVDAEGFEEAFVPASSATIINNVTDNQYYKSDEEYVYAVADALKTEYEAIVNAGFLLQVDAPEMPGMYDRMQAEGGNIEAYRRFANLCVDVTNHALQNVPEDRVRYHICWGSWNGPHTGDIPLREVAGILLQVKAQAYSVEAANPRHEHEWEVWRDVKLPEGKILIPGVIAHTTNVVEHPELVAMRLKNYASVVGKENVIGGTDCGFSQGWNAARVHPSIQWAKLKALADGAALASRQLWG